MTWYMKDGVLYHSDSGELYHYGVKGMKWGVRRYQNKDGSLTSAGKKRRSDDDGYIKEESGGIRVLTKKGHDAEVSRRKKITEEEMLSELRELNKAAWTEPEDPNYDNAVDQFVKFQREIYDFIGDPGDRSSEYMTSKALKKRFDEYWKPTKEYREARGRFALAEKHMSKTNRFISKLTGKAEKDPLYIKAKDELDKTEALYRKLGDKVDYTKYKDDARGIILEELGYKNTPETRELIKSILDF